MAGYGVPEYDIARVLGIDPKTLRKHYRDELDTGHVKANAKVAESLFRKATGDGRQSVTAAIFWLKTRAGWKETSVHEIGPAPDFPTTIDLVSARDQLKARIARLSERRESIDDRQMQAGEEPSAGDAGPRDTAVKHLLMLFRSVIR